MAENTFFCPGTETKRRTESIFTKEPETTIH